MCSHDLTCPCSCCTPVGRSWSDSSFDRTVVHRSTSSSARYRRVAKGLAFGLNYWLYESVPLKLTYEINGGGTNDNRVLAQLAYGF